MKYPIKIKIHVAFMALFGVNLTDDELDFEWTAEKQWADYIKPIAEAQAERIGKPADEITKLSINYIEGYLFDIGWMPMGI